MRPPSSRPGSGPGSDAAALTVAVHEWGWRRLVKRADAVARRAALAAGGSGTVVLASDRAVQRLNARHRGRNKPTNVLSFPAPPELGEGAGDLVLALGVVRREARREGKRPDHHLAHLVVHGTLHLAGHDHGGVGEARRMEAHEARILRRIGVANPWRTGRPRAEPSP